MRNERQPFNGNPDTGLNAFLYPDERPDGTDDLRPRIVYRHPFWKDEEERIRYERAASLCPVSASGSLTLDQYLGEIVKLAEGIKPGEVREMPAVSNWKGVASEPEDRQADC